VGEQIRQTWWSIGGNRVCCWCWILYLEARELDTWTVEQPPTEVFGHEETCYSATLFGSSYACEQLFFAMNFVKSTVRNRLGSDLSASYHISPFKVENISSARNQRESLWHLLSRWYLAQIIFSTLKLEAICSSETSVDTQRTTRHYIPEDGTVYNHRCENLKSYNAHIVRIRECKLRSIVEFLPMPSGQESCGNVSVQRRVAERVDEEQNFKSCSSVRWFGRCHTAHLFLNLRRNHGNLRTCSLLLTIYDVNATTSQVATSPPPPRPWNLEQILKSWKFFLYLFVQDTKSDDGLKRTYSASMLGRTLDFILQGDSFGGRHELVIWWKRNLTSTYIGGCVDTWITIFWNWFPSAWGSTGRHEVPCSRMSKRGGITGWRKMRANWAGRRRVCVAVYTVLPGLVFVDKLFRNLYLLILGLLQTYISQNPENERIDL
jgi:hypothetical protein